MQDLIEKIPIKFVLIVSNGGINRALYYYAPLKQSLYSYIVCCVTIRKLQWTVKYPGFTFKYAKGLISVDMIMVFIIFVYFYVWFPVN